MAEPPVRGGSRAGHADESSTRSPRSISRSSAATTARAPAGSSHRSTRTSSCDGSSRRRTPRRRRPRETGHERRSPAASRRRRHDPRRRRSARARTRRSSTAPSSSTPSAGASSARARRSRRSATPPRSGSARRSRAAPRPTARRSPTCAPPRRAAGTRITELDAALAETEAALDDLLLRIPNPPDPDIPVGGEEANVTIRTWGEMLARDQPLVGEVGADAPAGGATWTRKPHWELGEALDILDNARGAKITGSGFPVYKGAGSALQRGADQLVPRRPHPRERHDRGLAAGRRQHGERDGHRPDPGQGRPDVRRDPRRAVPGPDRRGPGHQPPPRRDPRGRPSCRSATRPTRRASGARPARPARTPAASCASTSSTRSRWSCSSGPRTRRRRSSG